MRSASRSLRGAERLEFVEQARGGAEVAHLDRRAHGLLKGEALQFERQRRGRGLERTEAFARLGPFALPRQRERAPQRASLRLAAGRLRQVLQRVGAAPEHDVGDGAQHSGGAVLRGALVGRRDVEHALGFGGQVARQIEARELELRRRAPRLLARRPPPRSGASGGRGNQLRGRSPRPADRA